jgi:hypothetical protein
VARRDGDEWLIDFGHVGLEVIKLSHVLLNASELVFFLHVRDRPEVRAVGPVFVLVGSEVDGVAERVAVHRVDPANDVVDQLRRERVIAVLAIHLDHAEIVYGVAVNVVHLGAPHVLGFRVQSQSVLPQAALGYFQ